MQLTTFLAAAFTVAAARAYDFGYIPSQLGRVQAYQTSRFLECRALVGTCAPTKASCASAVCEQCTSIVGTFPARINSCCAQARPTDCFLGGGAAAPTATTATGAAPTDGTTDRGSMTTPPPTTSPASMSSSDGGSGSSATPAPSTTSSRAGAGGGRDLRAEAAVAGMAGVGLLAWAL